MMSAEEQAFTKALCQKPAWYVQAMERKPVLLEHKGWREMWLVAEVVAEPYTQFVRQSKEMRLLEGFK